MAKDPSPCPPDDQFHNRNYLTSKFIHMPKPFKNPASYLSFVVPKAKQRQTLSCDFLTGPHKLLVSAFKDIQEKVISPNLQRSVGVHVNLIMTMKGASTAMRKAVTESVEISQAKFKDLFLLHSQSSQRLDRFFLQHLHDFKLPSSIDFLNFLTRIENIRTSASIIRQQMPMLASISPPAPLKLTEENIPEAKHLFDVAFAPEQVAKAINGIPVYTVSNSSNEFMLVSDLDGAKSLGILCFRHEDAEALLAQVKHRDPSLGRGARVVEVMLDKVYAMKAEGIAFRFLPDPLQVKHAIEERSKRGDTSKGFSGVPIFQSENLILKIKNRRCCPIFFCKEDLQNALTKAIIQQKRSNPSLKVNTELQVGSFEDVLKRMEASEEDSAWADIVFIPPGMDARNHLDKAMANNSVLASNPNSQTESQHGSDTTVFC